MKYTLAQLLKIVNRHPKLAEYRPDPYIYFAEERETFYMEDGKITVYCKALDDEYPTSKHTERLVELLTALVHRTVKEELEQEAIERRMDVWASDIPVCFINKNL